MTQDTQLRDLRRLTYYFQNGDISHNLLRAEDVGQMVAAILKLHHTPGINPRTGKPTTRIYSIVVSRLALGPSHWWSTPSLGANGENDGARLIGYLPSETIFFDPDLSPYADEPDTYATERDDAASPQNTAMADDAALKEVRDYWNRVIEIGQETRLDNYSLGRVLRAGVVIGPDGRPISDLDEEPAEVVLPPPRMSH